MVRNLWVGPWAMGDALGVMVSPAFRFTSQCLRQLQGIRRSRQFRKGLQMAPEEFHGGAITFRCYA